jgi:hypothetical protein
VYKRQRGLGDVYKRQGLNICLKTAWHVPSKVWDCPQPRKWLICKNVWLL